MQHSFICKVFPALLPISPSKHLDPHADQTPRLITDCQVAGRTVSPHPQALLSPTSRKAMLVSLLPCPLPFLLKRVSCQRLCLSCHPDLRLYQPI